MECTEKGALSDVFVPGPVKAVRVPEGGGSL